MDRSRLEAFSDGVIVATFNAVAAFVLIVLVAVYYIVENTPASQGSGNWSGDQPMT